MKLQSFIDETEKILEEMKSGNNDYFANQVVKTSHTARIDCLQMSSNGKYLVSASKDLVCVWDGLHGSMKLLLKLPL